MRCLAVLLVVLVACNQAGKRSPAWPDAPMQMRDDADRDQAIDRLWVLPLGGERDAKRNAIAIAIVHRITDALAEDKPLIAELLLFQLASLWQLDPNAVPTLGAHIEVVRKLIMCAQHSNVARITVTVEEEVANYINNRKRRDLLRMEDEHKVQVVVLSREDLTPEFLKFECEDSSGREVRVPDV